MPQVKSWGYGASQPSSSNGAHAHGGSSSHRETKPLVDIHSSRRGWGAWGHRSEAVIDAVAPPMMEAVGALILTCTAALVTSHKDWAPEQEWIDRNSAGMAMGTVLALLTYAGARVSGSHYNPTITLGCLILKQVTPIKALIYIAAQVAGGVAGAGLACGIVGRDEIHTFSRRMSGQMWVVETIFAFALVYVVFQTMVSRGQRRNGFYGLAVGSVVAAGTSVGAVINPCIATGLAVIKHRIEGLMWLWLLPFIGTAAAIVIYSFSSRSDTDYEHDDHDDHHHHDGHHGSSSYHHDDHHHGSHHDDHHHGYDEENISHALEQCQHASRPFTPYIVEFVGTFMFTLAMGLAYRINPWLTPAMTVASTLLAMTCAGRYVSGAHFNPAVTIGVFLRYPRRREIRKTLLFIGIQIIAGLAGGAAVVTGGDGYPGRGFPIVGNGRSAWEAMLAEAVFALALVFVVLRTPYSDDKANQFFPVGVSLAMVVGIIGAGRISCGVLNPAAATGLIITGSYDRPTELWLYWLGPILGAAVAAGIAALADARMTHFKDYSNSSNYSTGSSNSNSSYGHGSYYGNGYSVGRGYGTTSRHDRDHRDHHDSGHGHQ